ncbi:hypothetical protein GGS20DRAFT_266601 [Poronia punctata]|nr:hypothetical protein GGS20DRAFT_266601 [Poronia punctata]
MRGGACTHNLFVMLYRASGYHRERLLVLLTFSWELSSSSQQSLLRLSAPVSGSITGSGWAVEDEFCYDGDCEAKKALSEARETEKERGSRQNGSGTGQPGLDVPPPVAVSLQITYYKG